MTVYKDLDLINETISYLPNDWGCYVHIDKKSSIDVKDINAKAVVYKNHKINWGSIQHLEAFLFLLKKTYNNPIDYDYFHLITGQDYFVAKPQDFDKILGSDGYSYMQYVECPDPRWSSWGGGLDILKYRTLASYVDLRKKKWHRLNKLYRIAQYIMHLERQLPPYPVYGGLVYMSLTREAVKEVLYGFYAKDLLKRLKCSTDAEEIFFQTALLNSSCKNRIRNDNLRYVDWNAVPAPKTLVRDDYDKIVNSGMLFCRKVDSVQSKDLIVRLRERL